MTINCRGKLVDLSVPKIMGILNLTPDSFYDGGYYDDLIARGKELIAQGANWLDIGGESTRPGAEQVTEKEEICRVIPVIEALKNENVTLRKELEKNEATVNEGFQENKILSEKFHILKSKLSRLQKVLG